MTTTYNFLDLDTAATIRDRQATLRRHLDATIRPDQPYLVTFDLSREMDLEWICSYIGRDEAMSIEQLLQAVANTRGSRAFQERFSGFGIELWQSWVSGRGKAGNADYNALVDLIKKQAALAELGYDLFPGTSET